MERSDRRDRAFGLLATLPRSTTLAEGTAKSWRVGGRAQACWLTLGGHLVPRLCAATAGGAILARGEGYAEEGEAVGPWLLVALRASLMWSLSERVRLGPSIDGEAWLVRPQLVLRSPDGGGVAGTATSVLGLSIALSVEGRL